MKHLKTYEATIFPKYKIGKYIIWSDEYEWEICKIISKYDLNRIKVENLYYLDNNELKTTAKSEDFIDLMSYEEREAIKYVSDNLDDCKEKIMLMANINKYNL